MPGGAFNIPAGEQGKLSVSTFCLEHGKEDPVPQMEYKIIPLKEFNNDPAVEVLCRMLANDKIDTQVAQAAAWNIANGLNWMELLTMNRIERMDGSFERYFRQDQVIAAQQVAGLARGQAALLQSEAKAETTPQKIDSESRIRELDSGSRSTTVENKSGQ